MSPLLSSQEPKILAFLTSTGKSWYDITILTSNDSVPWLFLTLPQTLFLSVTTSVQNCCICELRRYMRKRKYTFFLLKHLLLHATFPEGKWLRRNTASKFYRDCRKLTYGEVAFLLWIEDYLSHELKIFCLNTVTQLLEVIKILPLFRVNDILNA